MSFSINFGPKRDSVCSVRALYTGNIGGLAVAKFGKKSIFFFCCILVGDLVGGKLGGLGVSVGALECF